MASPQVYIVIAQEIFDQLNNDTRRLIASRVTYIISEALGEPMDFISLRWCVPVTEDTPTNQISIEAMVTLRRIDGRISREDRVAIDNLVKDLRDKMLQLIVSPVTRLSDMQVNTKIVAYAGTVLTGDRPSFSY